MCQLSRCCCCFTLKMGVYLSACYTMILGAVGVVYMIWLLVSGLNEARDYAVQLLEKQSGNKYSKEQIESGVDRAISLEQIVLAVLIVVYAIWALFACLMPWGLAKGKRWYLMPWIALTYILLVLDVLGLVFYIHAMAEENLYTNSGTWLIIGLLGMTILANGMSVCGVTSYFKNNLKEEGDIALVPNEAPPAYECSDYKNAV